LSVETIAGLAEETAATLDTLKEALAAAQSFHDGDLQPHALRARRETLATEARATAEQAVAGTMARLESTAVASAKKLDATRPKIAANDPAALIRAEQSWNYDVRPLLEGGAPIKSILRDAGVDELLAIERFGVGYLRAAKLAAGPGNTLEMDPEELSVAVNNRLATALPEGERAAFEDGIRTADAAAKLREIHGMAAASIAGQTVHPSSAWAHARSLAIKLRG
jgi:hypothetical protein